MSLSVVPDSRDVYASCTACAHSGRGGVHAPPAPQTIVQTSLADTVL
jgi:hypothetical protein